MTGYDELDLPPEVRDEDLVLAWWDADAGQWVPLPSMVNTEAGKMAAMTDRLGTFSVGTECFTMDLPLILK